MIAPVIQADRNHLRQDELLPAINADNAVRT